MDGAHAGHAGDFCSAPIHGDHDPIVDHRPLHGINRRVCPGARLHLRQRQCEATSPRQQQPACVGRNGPPANNSGGHGRDP